MATLETNVHGEERWVEAIDMTTDEPPAPNTPLPHTPRRAAQHDAHSIIGTPVAAVPIVARPNRTVTPVTNTETPLPSTPTPRRQTKEPPPALWSTPERVNRYIPIVSTAEQVEYRNPHKFCMKPAFWKKWGPSDYASFAQHLSSQFDPVPFARERGLPVEEVRQVFKAVVRNPLYDSGEASRRGEEGMAELFDLYNQYGTLARRWGKAPARRVHGELDSVEKGVVVLSGKDSGDKYELATQDLSDEDVKYLVKVLSEIDLQLLWS